MVVLSESDLKQKRPHSLPRGLLFDVVEVEIEVGDAGVGLDFRMLYNVL